MVYRPVLPGDFVQVPPVRRLLPGGYTQTPFRPTLAGRVISVNADSDPLAGITLFTRLQPQNGNSIALGLYQDAACTIPATVLDDPIGGIRDNRGEGAIIATQSSAGNRPTLAFLSGRPVIKFDQAQQQYLNFSLAVDFGNTDLTIVAGVYAISGAFEPWLEQNTITTRFVLWHNDDFSRVFANAFDTGVPSPEGVTAVDSYRRDGTDILHQVNGNLPEEYTAATFVASGGNLWLGRGSADGSDYFNGYLGLLFVADTVSNADLQVMKRYAASLLDVDDFFVDAPFIMSSFEDNAGIGTLRLSFSDDGIAWTDSECIFTPPSGSCRDASIFRGNGGWWICYTSGTFAGGTSFGIAFSTDAVTWTHLVEVDCTDIPGVQHLWAPQWDETLNDGSVIFAATDEPNFMDGGFVQYRKTPTNSTWTTWGASTAITGLPANCIDAFPILDGSTYEMWVKNEDTDLVEVYTASSILGPYSALHTGNWAGWGSGIEGPSLVYLGGTNWRLYVDAYQAGTGTHYAESTDDRVTWTALTAITAATPVVRHAHVVKQTP